LITPEGNGEIEMKEAVLTETNGLSPGRTTFRPKGKLLEFLDGL
jgi:hypothetical protein